MSQNEIWRKLVEASVKEIRDNEPALKKMEQRRGRIFHSK